MKRNRLALQPLNMSSTHQTDQNYTNTGVLYFQVLYSKRAPNKKRQNKKFFDGVMEVQGNKLYLYSEEGKCISKDRRKLGSETLELGEEICVGFFDVEMDCPLEEAKFKSGECFIQLQSPSASPQQPIGVLTQQIQSKQLNLFSKTTEKKKALAPLYDPNADGAIILNSKQLNQAQENRASPIVVDPYIGSKLRPHQIEGVKFLYECVMGLNDAMQTGAILADEMGLGKTLQIICLIWTLLKQGQGGKPSIKKAIVVCPSTLVSNWSKEVRKWLGSERLQTLDLHPSKDAPQKVQDFKNSPFLPLLIVSYETLRIYAEQLKGHSDLLICDEGHRLKSCASTNKTVQALLGLNCPRRIILTGTPVQNNMREFFCLMDFVNPGSLGSPTQFKRLYEDTINASREPDASEEQKMLGEERSKGLQMLINKYLLRRTAEINKEFLPPLSQYVLFCPPTDTQIELYRAVVRNNKFNKIMSSYGDSFAGKILKYITFLKKICNDPRLLYNEDLQEILGFENGQSKYEQLQQTLEHAEEIDSGKLRCLNTIIQEVAIENQEKVVVVSTSTNALDLIGQICLRSNVKIVRIDGSTDVTERQVLVDNFNNNKGVGEVFLLSTRAGGAGLNLTGASRLVLFDSDWNPAMDQQAMARIWRDGQRNPCVVYRMLTTGSIEEKIYQRQILKQDLAHLMQNSTCQNSSAQQFTRDELRQLIHLNLNSQCDTYDLLKARGLETLSGWINGRQPQETEDVLLSKLFQLEYLNYVQVVAQGIDESCDSN
eukprot:TRINITY_DN5588_c0_g3_i2.p1 TRINITY_DN5588_c0_g3~~TRINITY_DN5588_c0_g3_i2.p1  ORF type:complete len:771 (+),score=69.67 TRINITY_DN5588_c0_g3_i2:134-2446(+)